MLYHSAVDKIFHALAEPNRRAIVEQLSAGPQSVSELARPFDLTLAAIGHHLQVLEESGLIRSAKLGRTRTCQIDPAGLKLAATWIEGRRALWERRFDRLEHILALDDRAGRPSSESENLASTKNRKPRSKKP